jgi:hypothetical protein
MRVKLETDLIIGDCQLIPVFLSLTDIALRQKESNMPDEFKMSGDFRGAVINIKSTLTNVQQSVGGMSTNDPVAREELEKLIGQLSDALQKVPEEHKEQAQAVADLTQTFVESAKAENPNKTTLQITGDGLKKAAQNLAEVMPTVLPIATQIIMAITKIIGQ